MNSSPFKETPWDTKVFGIYTAEVIEYSDAALSKCNQEPGLYTLKLDPLQNKTLAQKYGFYYCDTLLVPECAPEELIKSTHENISISQEFNQSDVMDICNGVFEHGRFHRDLHLSKHLANARYNQWLEDLLIHGQVYALLYKKEIAGFIATKGNELQLHAVSKKFRGQGLAKYWWAAVCQELFAQGNQSITSSISASNLAVMNLYSNLGFRFTKSLDVYHKFIS